MEFNPFDPDLVVDHELKRFANRRAVFALGVEWGIFYGRMETGFVFSMYISEGNRHRVKRMLVDMRRPFKTKRVHESLLFEVGSEEPEACEGS